MILDTSFVIDLVRGREEAAGRLQDVQDRRRPQKVSAVTVLELYEGVRRAERTEDERQTVLDVLDSKTIVPADHSVMRRAGQISGDLHVSGSPIEREDCIVAATALREDEPVVTRDSSHFERVPDVDTVTY